MRVMLLSVAAALAFSTVPAAASSDVCAVAPGALRSLAASADAATQRKAVRNIALGEALCDARNRVEAQRKFAAAAKTLGTDLATATGGQVSAQLR
jgi:hypothetical protein